MLTYHSVASNEVAEFVDPPNRIEPQLFERQMAFLSKHRRVIPLSQLVDEIMGGIEPPAGTVSITFDDGYLDNLTIAAPILNGYQLPATLFLATGYVTREESQWADLLYWMLSKRTSEILEVAGKDPAVFDLTSSNDLALARKSLHRRMLEASYAERTELLNEVRSQLKPIGSPPRLALTWDDIRLLRRDFPQIEVGGHTRDHIDLSLHNGSVARSQVDGCAEDIRNQLGCNPVHFSFPYGRSSKETREIVASLGWRSAVGDGDHKRVGPASNVFCIPRINAPQTMTELRFKTSGAYPGIFPQSPIG